MLAVVLYSLQLHHCTTARGNKRRWKISSSLGCAYVRVWKQCCDAQLSQSSPCCLCTANCIINGHNCSYTQLQWLMTLMDKACKFLCHCRTSYMSSSQCAELSWIILGPTAHAPQSSPQCLRTLKPPVHALILYTREGKIQQLPM